MKMTTNSSRRLVPAGACLALATLLAAASAAAADWPGWRGPAGNAVSPDVPAAMPPKRVLWTQSMSGECHAGVAAAEGSVVVADHGAGKDHWRCYDAADGKVRWTYAYDNTEEMDYGAAPRATPLIHQGRVFCLNAWGDLYALDLKTGRLLWQKSFAKDFGSGDPPMWGFCSSPLIAAGKVVVNPGGADGGLVALEPDSGNVAWSARTSEANYSSFIVATLGGVEQVVGYDVVSLGGWDAKTGKRLWLIEAESSGGYIVPTPVAAAGKLIVTDSEAYTRAFAFDDQGRIKPEAEAYNEDLYPEMSTPTVLGDTLVGASEGLVCLDLKDALKTLWLYEDDDSVFGIVHTVASKDRLLAFCDDGVLLLIAADKTACRVLGREKLCDQTWSHPALTSGRLYVRDKANLYCFDLGAAGAPAEAAAEAADAEASAAPEDEDAPAAEAADSEPSP